MRETIRRGAPDGLMLVGAGTALAGLYLLAGLAWVLLATGIVLAVYGAMADLRWR